MKKEYCMIPGVWSVYSLTFKQLWEYPTEKKRDNQSKRIDKLENDLWEHWE